MKDRVSAMHQTSRQTPLSFWTRIQKASLCILLFSFFLLSACSGTTSQSSTSAGTNKNLALSPTPGISLTQQNEGNTQLQTFQQWIALMQQYHGDVATDQQPYSSDH